MASWQWESEEWEMKEETAASGVEEGAHIAAISGANFWKIRKRGDGLLERSW